MRRRTVGNVGTQLLPAVRPSRKDWLRPGLRIVFGVIWLVDAAFKWLPGFLITYQAGLVSGFADQPGWLRPWFRFWV